MVMPPNNIGLNNEHLTTQDPGRNDARLIRPSETLFTDGYSIHEKIVDSSNRTSSRCMHTPSCDKRLQPRVSCGQASSKSFPGPLSNGQGGLELPNAAFDPDLRNDFDIAFDNEDTETFFYQQPIGNLGSPEISCTTTECKDSGFHADTIDPSLIMLRPAPPIHNDPVSDTLYTDRENGTTNGKAVSEQTKAQDGSQESRQEGGAVFLRSREDENMINEQEDLQEGILWNLGRHIQEDVYQEVLPSHTMSMDQVEGLSDNNYPPHCLPSPTEAADTQLQTSDSPPAGRVESANSADHTSQASIASEVQDGVIRLFPTNEQWNDFPSLLSCARRLGAEDVGAPKVLLGKTELSLCRPSGVTSSQASVFHAHPEDNGTYRVEREEAECCVEADVGTCNISPTGELVRRFDRLLQSRSGLNGIRYCTDLEAKTFVSRMRIGLPEKSPIWPLKGNQLDHTRYCIPEIHWPYAYVSHKTFGAPFCFHKEDAGLIYVNILHAGRKIWTVIAPKHSHLLEAKLRTTIGSYDRYECAQFLRHCSTYLPMSVLDQWGIPYRVISQVANEVVVSLTDAYHGGFSTGFTLAEAVNYADLDWNIRDYRQCNSAVCPVGLIPNEMMEFRSGNEAQREMEQGEEEEQEEEQEEEAAAAAAEEKESEDGRQEEDVDTHNDFASRAKKKRHKRHCNGAKSWKTQRSNTDETCTRAKRKSGSGMGNLTKKPKTVHSVDTKTSTLGHAHILATDAEVEVYKVRWSGKQAYTVHPVCQSFPGWHDLARLSFVENATQRYSEGDIVRICLHGGKDDSIAKIREIRDLGGPSKVILVVWYYSKDETRGIKDNSWPRQFSHILGNHLQALMSTSINGKLMPKELSKIARDLVVDVHDRRCRIYERDDETKWLFESS